MARVCNVEVTRGERIVGIMEGAGACDRKPGIAVVGVGDTLKGDDGVGLLIAEELEGTIDQSLAHVVPSPTAEMRLIRYFRDYGTVIFIDSIDVPDAAPGSVFRLDLDDPLIQKLRSNTPHGDGVAELTVCSRLIGADPQVIIYGIQVGDVRQNDRILTPPVAEAAEKLREQVARDIEELHAPCGERAS